MTVTSLFSCSQTLKSYITWQNFPISFSGNIYANGFFSSLSQGVEAEIKLSAPYVGSISFLSPESLKGYTVVFENGNATVIYSDIESPLPEVLARQIMILAALFDLDEENLLSVSLTEHDGKKTNEASFSLYLPKEYSDAEVRVKDNNCSESSGQENNLNNEDDSVRIGEVKIYINASDGIPFRFEAILGKNSLVIDMNDFTYS